MKETITINRSGSDATARQAVEKNNQVTFKNCVSFTDCFSKIRNIPINNAKDLDIAMSMHNLLEHSDNYTKT